MKTLQVYALVGDRFEPQGGPVSVSEFLTLNDDLPIGDKIAVWSLERGEHTHLNLGAGGIVKIECVDDCEHCSTVTTVQAHGSRSVAVADVASDGVRSVVTFSE